MQAELGAPNQVMQTKEAEEVNEVNTTKLKEESNAVDNTTPKAGCTELTENLSGSLSSSNKLTEGRCHPLLESLCPACFGGSKFGRSFQECVIYSKFHV